MDLAWRLLQKMHGRFLGPQPAVHCTARPPIWLIITALCVKAAPPPAIATTAALQRSRFLHSDTRHLAVGRAAAPTTPGHRASRKKGEESRNRTEISTFLFFFFCSYFFSTFSFPLLHYIHRSCDHSSRRRAAAALSSSPKSPLIPSGSELFVPAHDISTPSPPGSCRAADIETTRLFKRPSGGPLLVVAVDADGQEWRLWFLGQSPDSHKGIAALHGWKLRAALPFCPRPAQVFQPFPAQMECRLLDG